MTFYALRRQAPIGVGEETRAAWSTIVRQWRRVLLSAVPLLALSLWTVHKDSVLELLGTAFFVFAGILLLCRQPNRDSH
jgi:hypothetical protein